MELDLVQPLPFRVILVYRFYGIVGCLCIRIAGQEFLSRKSTGGHPVLAGYSFLLDFSDGIFQYIRLEPASYRQGNEWAVEVMTP